MYKPQRRGGSSNNSAHRRIIRNAKAIGWVLIFFISTALKQRPQAIIIHSLEKRKRNKNKNKNKKRPETRYHQIYELNDSYIGIIKRRPKSTSDRHTRGGR